MLVLIRKFLVRFVQLMGIVVAGFAMRFVLLMADQGMATAFWNLLEDAKSVGVPFVPACAVIAFLAIAIESISGKRTQTPKS
jgi:hypothetical protein